MTLEAWVYPTTVNKQWRDVFYKGNDDYFLMAHQHERQRDPSARGTFVGAAEPRSFGTANAREQHLDASGDDL